MPRHAHRPTTSLRSASGPLCYFFCAAAGGRERAADAAQARCARRGRAPGLARRGAAADGRARAQPPDGSRVHGDRLRHVLCGGGLETLQPHRTCRSLAHALAACGSARARVLETLQPSALERRPAERGCAPYTAFARCAPGGAARPARAARAASRRRRAGHDHDGQLRGAPVGRALGDARLRRPGAWLGLGLGLG